MNAIEKLRTLRLYGVELYLGSLCRFFVLCMDFFFGVPNVVHVTAPVLLFLGLRFRKSSAISLECDKAGRLRGFSCG